MEAVTVFTVIASGLLLVCVFVLGGLFAVHLMTDAQDSARYEELKRRYYEVSGYRHPGDPKPYVPPRSLAVSGRGMLPHMNALDRMMRSGKRGTILWTADDRKKVG